MKTPDQVRAEFERHGLTIRGWARRHGFSERIVREVLRGRFKGKYGQAHKVAVLLGIKDGVIDEGA